MISRKEMEARYASALSDKQGKNEICLFWFKQSNQFSWGDKEMMADQMKTWRKLAKEGEIKIMEYNNRETKHGNKTIYHFIVQPYKNEKMIECSICPYALMVLGIMVDGFTYSFWKKENRDAIYNYVMKGISQPDES
jgi:hypothetical protein